MLLYVSDYEVRIADCNIPTTVLKEWAQKIFIGMKKCIEPFVNKKVFNDLENKLILIETHNNTNIRACIKCVLCMRDGSKSPNVYLSCKIRDNIRYWNMQNFKRHLGRNHQTDTNKVEHSVQEANEQKTAISAIASDEEETG